jgi:NAD(P)-dependent dehydrogenase (short-subunit alcohol dehydrogenase family)
MASNPILPGLVSKIIRMNTDGWNRGDVPSYSLASTHAHTIPRPHMSRHILITGCSSGFGHDAAKRFAAKGDHVYATMRNVEGRNADNAQALRDVAAEGGHRITVLDMDVLSDESVRSAVAQTESVDVLINNAGLGYGGPVESFESSEILRQLDLNIVGTARVAQTG